MKQNNLNSISNQGNINLIITKNSELDIPYDEFINEGLKVFDKYGSFSNLNMNIIFINNIIISNEDSVNSIEEHENTSTKSKELKLKNNNLNILVIKNLINVQEFLSND